MATVIGVDGTVDRVTVIPFAQTSDTYTQVENFKAEDFIRFTKSVTLSNVYVVFDKLYFNINSGARYAIFDVSAVSFEVGGSDDGSIPPIVMNWETFSTTVLGLTWPFQANAAQNGLAATINTDGSTSLDSSYKFILMTSGTYSMGTGNHKYIAAPEVLEAGTTVEVRDRKGTTVVQLLNGLEVGSSTASITNWTLQVRGGTTLSIWYPRDYKYELGGDPINGISGNIYTFAELMAFLYNAVPPDSRTGFGSFKVDVPGVVVRGDLSKGLVLEDIIERIELRLGSRRGLQDTIKLELQSTIRKLEEGPVKFWFLLTDTLNSRTIPEERRMSIPKGFLREDEQGALWVNLPEGRRGPLVKGSDDILCERFSGQGVPRSYSLTNNYFRLYPEPDIEYDMDIQIYRRTPVIFEGESNPWFEFAEELVVAATCKAMAIGQRDGNAIKLFSQMESEEYRKLLVEHEARAAANSEEFYGEYYG